MTLYTITAVSEFDEYVTYDRNVMARSWEEALDLYTDNWSTLESEFIVGVDYADILVGENGKPARYCAVYVDDELMSILAAPSLPQPEIVNYIAEMQAKHYADIMRSKH